MASMRQPFRHAVCNEAFENYDFAAACAAIRRIGYTGIELAPFTLKQPAPELRSIMAEEGLEFVGLHWLMVGPAGLHLTTPDQAVRERSWQHLRALIDLCGDLGGGVMVLGSPKQRSSTGGMGPAEATKHFRDGLAALAPYAEERGATLLIEALSPAQTDVVTTLNEAAALVDEIASPAVQTMFDTHNAVDETEPHEALVERWFAKIRHVHVNEMDGRHPGTGTYDFKPVFRTLERLGYAGWISLEAFDFSPGAERLAAESLRYLEADMERI